MEITKTITKHYKIFQVAEKPFTKYGRYREVRESHGMSCQKTCFNCGRKFTDDEDFFLICATGGNRLVCEECNHKLLEEFKKEKQ